MKDRQQVYSGHIVDVETGTVILPNGCEMALEMVRHPGGAAVVAVDEQLRVCLLYQYRPVLERWLWELPAGKIDAGEPPEATAQRELAEEAGMTASNWQALGPLVSSPGVFTEVVHLYLATGLGQTARQPDDHEVFEVHWLDLDEAIARVKKGEIRDAKTVAGLMLAAAVIRQDPGPG